MPVKHKIRKDGTGKTQIVSLTAKEAILRFCKECMGYKAREIKFCPDKLCPLYPFRLRGKSKGSEDKK